MEDAALARRALEEALREDPSAFGFFQAVRLLEELRPDREPVGHFVDPSREVVRFSAHRSIAFPPGEIHSLDWDDSGPASMRVNFLGLIGPQGVLPHHYTELTIERGRIRESPLGDFLDLFHHRILSLFYRAWKKYRVAVEVGKEGDALREHLLDLVGMGLPATREGLPFEEEALVFYAGLLAAPQRSAVALEQLLEDYFGVPVQVSQFEGGWYPLPEHDLCALSEDGTGPSSCLGRGAVVGDEIWDPQSRVRIRIGPLPFDQYERFLPTGDAYARLRELTRFYGRDEYEFELQLVLAAQEVPGVVLGDDTHRQPLGWATWIRSAEFSRDADDTILKL
ncbi:MAG TPA: type VI secretion system baseplate subunit TssG [Longimicrobiaceae bacterium]